MPPNTFKERLAESEDRVDRELFLDALEYVRDDGRSSLEVEQYAEYRVYEQ